MAGLRWDRCDPHQPWLRISRTRFAGGGLGREHAHDFAEWCWVESGRIVHAGGLGREQLRRGDARFLRPGAAHALGGDGVLVTASLPGGLFAELERRYRGHAAWPWGAGGSVRLDDAQLRALDRLVAAAPDRGQERVDAEWFVAALLRLLRPSGAARGTIPPWLEAAVAGLAEPGGLAGGLAELVRRSGRGAAHVSRAVRRAYGCTATDLVHRRRCEWAARELRLGTRPITAIAADAGYAHLGHFYRRFAQVFATTPRAYRHAVLGDEGPTDDLPVR